MSSFCQCVKFWTREAEGSAQEDANVLFDITTTREFMNLHHRSYANYKVNEVFSDFFFRKNFSKGRFHSRENCFLAAVDIPPFDNLKIFVFENVLIESFEQPNG